MLVYLQFSDDGQNIRKFSHQPFEGGKAFHSPRTDTTKALRKAQELLRELEAPAHLDEGADLDDEITAILARIDGATA